MKNLGKYILILLICSFFTILKSITTLQFAGTEFFALPPFIIPTFIVVYGIS